VNRAGRLSLGRFELAAASIGARRLDGGDIGSPRSHVRRLARSPPWQIAEPMVGSAVANCDDRYRRRDGIWRRPVSSPLRDFAVTSVVTAVAGKHTPASRGCRRFLVRRHKSRPRSQRIFWRRKLGKVIGRGTRAARLLEAFESSQAAKSTVETDSLGWPRVHVWQTLLRESETR